VRRWHCSLCNVASLSRQLQAIGHTVRLMLPAYVKPYVKRQKNDAADRGVLRSGQQAKHAVRGDQDP
jgi:transposase